MRKKLVIFILASVLALTSGCGTVPQAAPGPYRLIKPVYREAPLTVNAITEGQNFPVNIVRLTEMSAGRSISVNGMPAIPTAGETFLFLNAGDNTIQFNDAAGKVSEKFNVTFMPPLAVYLAGYNIGENYSEPVRAYGYVNRPDAAVTVNGKMAYSADDGEFVALVPLSYLENNLQAVATMGDEETQHTVTQFLDRKTGLLTPAPGSELRYATRFLLPDSPVVSLKPGTSASTGVTFQVNTSNGVWPLRFYVKPYEDFLGITARINQDDFDGYPNTEYHLTATFSAAPDAVPGEYIFRLDAGPFGSTVASTNIKIVVTP